MCTTTGDKLNQTEKTQLRLARQALKMSPLFAIVSGLSHDDAKRIINELTFKTKRKTKEVQHHNSGFN